MRAGTPAAIEYEGMSCVTTLPAAIVTPSPMFTPGKTQTFAPSHTFLPIATRPLLDKGRSAGGMSNKLLSKIPCALSVINTLGPVSRLSPISMCRAADIWLFLPIWQLFPILNTGVWTNLPGHAESSTPVAISVFSPTRIHDVPVISETGYPISEPFPKPENLRFAKPVYICVPTAQKKMGSLNGNM